MNFLEVQSSKLEKTLYEKKYKESLYAFFSHLVSWIVTQNSAEAIAQSQNSKHQW